MSLHQTSTSVARSRTQRVPSANKATLTAPAAPTASSSSSTTGISALVSSASSNLSLFLTNLRLLDLDLLPDWPDISLTTFSAKDAAGGQKKRIQCVEWALYKLFTLWDNDEAQNKLRPFFPPIDQVQSLNLRAALLRGLEQAKKNGVLGRDAVVRRTMLDECKGERLEEVLAAFSSAVLKKLVAERSLNGGLEYRPTISEKLALENFGYKGDRNTLSTLILAHKASLSSLLAQKDATRQKYKDFEDLLSTKERNLVHRKELSKAPNKADRMIDDFTREKVRRTIRSNWTGNERWIDSLLLSDTNPSKGGLLRTDFDEVWTGVENGQIADIESQDSGLLQQLDERVRLQKSRLEKWNGFREKMFGNKPASPQKTDDSKSKPCGIQFNAHQNITIGQKDTDRIAERTTSLPAGYADILNTMKADFDGMKKAKMPDLSTLLRNSSRQTSFGSFQNITIPKSIEEPISDIGEWEDEPEELPPVPKPTKLPTTRSARHNQTETITVPKRRQLPQPRNLETRLTSNEKSIPDSIPDLDPPKREIPRISSRIARPPPPQRSESNNTRRAAQPPPPISKTVSPEAISPIEPPIPDGQESVTTTAPPPEPSPAPRPVSPTQALADEILASVSNASPSPNKKRHTLSLAERTRLSMMTPRSTHHHSYSQEENDDNDNEFDDEALLQSPSSRPNHNTSNNNNNTPRSHIHTKSEPAVPSPSAAATAAADEDEYEDLVARTRRSMAGFEAARQKAQLERRRSQRKSRMPQPRFFPSRVNEDEEGSRIVDELLEAGGGGDGNTMTEIDMETVFMSRPKIKASPPMSPLKSSWGEGEEEDDGLEI